MLPQLNNSVATTNGISQKISAPEDQSSWKSSVSKLDTAVAPTNEIISPKAPAPENQSRFKLWTMKGLKEFIGKNLFEIIVFGIASVAGFLWFNYYSLDKQSAVSNTKIEFLEKKFTESEILYKERVERELKLAKCRNGVILECLNKCNLQEILKRQNNCEFPLK